MGVDRFGNYTQRTCPMRGARSFATPRTISESCSRAWSLIRERGPDKIYVFTGLEHSLPLAAEELAFADDEIATAQCFALPIPTTSPSSIA